MKRIKIAYIGGGSKAWARVFMKDLALAEGLCGEIGLYDIDLPAAELNKRIGDRINESQNTISKWDYKVYPEIGEALDGADFVICSILPGTFDEMEADVHLPEEYGIYQSVGDTVGPGGVLRAMRTVPIYEGFAREIKAHCPEAWVINLTNPMTACTKTLYDVFPEIKAFGCCHEVFHAQEFLCCAAKEMLGIERPARQDIIIDACGVNHFTWITEANYKGTDLLALLPEFIDKFYESGYCEREGTDPSDFRDDPFRYGNKVKMDLFRRFGVLAAAGDRHLVEFMNNNWYISDEAAAESWLYHLTTVSYRKQDRLDKIARSHRLADGEEPVKVESSDEEVVELMKALLGLIPAKVSNANVVNVGQMPQMPLGSVVETNCVFAHNSLKPITSRPLPEDVNALVFRNAINIENTYYGIKARDLDRIFEAFMNQPLCSSLSVSQGRELFSRMTAATAEYLKDYYPKLEF
ncbi:alpha-glucosidase/alpha-galactosidase [Ruminococcus sp.]|uniref:family 4 glycosyl hydrolase n=1 Tax=Ruminococcus sp. TaxID=41978 RepID=UPI0025ED0978|nr:alpha-glucosidase/alpha-galactosidase [Ruminococcus sp.]MBQ8967419.1 alpha-glucosidase/alpha-galactosidase [Ruminococcus sp.]